MRKYRFIIPILFLQLTGCRSQQINLPEMKKFQDTAWRAVEKLDLPSRTNLNLYPKGSRMIASFTDGLQQNKYAEVKPDKKTSRIIAVRDLRNKK